MTLPSTRVIDVRNPGEGVMRPERGTGHQIRAHDDTSQSASNNWCPRQVVIGSRCHHRVTKKEAQQPSAKASRVERPGSNQGPDYSGVSLDNSQHSPFRPPLSQDSAKVPW